MKLKKMSIMTLAALYATGLGALVADPLSPELHQINNLVGVKITPELLEKYNNKHSHSANKAKSLGQNGINVHRAARGSNHRAPFVWENDIQGRHTYIIQLMDAPIALYQGERPDYAATSPRSQQSNLRSNGRDTLDVKSPAAKRYKQFLTQTQDRAVNQIRMVAPDAQIEQRFNVALNGMTLKLTQQQAADVAKMVGIKAVTRAKEYKLFTDAGPKHIGADMVWQGTSVPDGVELRGEGIIAGIIDTGINSDHPSFAAVAGDGYRHINPLGEGNYVGDCLEYPMMCNSKLIGVRSYNVITDAYKDPVYQPDVPAWDIEYKRPPNGEDYNGHGSHTASTVAGNLLYNVNFPLNGMTESSDGVPTPLVLPEVSGVAPRANIIAYQACYAGDGSYGETYGGCPGDALIAAIEDAIIDGVDVINFSIGGLESLPWYDAIEMAFLAARESGISVAASAGNWGQYGPSNIDHVSPWLTSVAASTHGRKIDQISGMLTDFADANAPQEIIGAGITGDFSGTLVDAATYGDALCLTPFPANTFNSNEIVLCKRGDIPRVDKGVNVAAGGAGAVVLYNAINWDDGSGGHTLNLNVFPIPGLHVDYNAGKKLTEWVAGAVDTQASIYASEIVTNEREADLLASFSSRGPSLTTPNVMVPNVSAPGVDVFAAYADEMPFSMFPAPSDYVAISGTSMSGPHVAGALALLTQAYPQWTPAMIQSALMTTALPGKSYSNTIPTKLQEATFYEMGSGVINVARAMKVGLVMDETADNYRAANPEEGGDVTALNVPYLVNSECKSSCTWMRTFTATTDGEWEISATGLEAEGAPFLELAVYPNSFSLKAGESQSIMVTANVLDVTSVNVNSSSNEVFGKVEITPKDNRLASQYLPVMARYSGSSLPEMVSGVIHRDNGTILTPELMTKEISELNVKVHGLTAGKMSHHKLSASKLPDFTQPETLSSNPGIDIQFFDVPEGTSRIVWEVTSEDKAAVSKVDIGMDLNANGLVEWHDEAICFSSTDLLDYCNINNPLPGRYWAMVSNNKSLYGDAKDTQDSIKTSLAIIANESNQALTITGPQSTNGLDPYQLQMHWTLPDAQKGDRFYGVIEVGSSADNEGNIGKMAIHLVHAGDDVAIVTSQEQAKEGDVVDVTVTLAPNTLGLERDVNLNVTLPEGLQLLEDTVMAISNNQSLQDSINIEGQQISLSTLQMASNAQQRKYQYTTSAVDESCRVPIGSNPYYLDLLSEAGITAEPAIQGRVVDTVILPLSIFGIEHIPLYNNNPDYMEPDTLTISPGGFIQLDSMPLFWPAHYPVAGDFFPDTIIAPLWRGDGATLSEYNLDTDSLDGVSMASTADGTYLIIEWDNMRQEFAWGVNFEPDYDARYSFEVIASSQIDFTPGKHEFIFAYDKLEGTKSHLGSIGLHGYYGPRGTFGPSYGYSGDGFAYDDLDVKIEEGLVVCANYIGPEQSEIKVSFSARVGATGVGHALSLAVDSDYTGSDSTTSIATINVPSNLSIGAINDMSVDENDSISFEVLIQDKENTANAIKVSGEHINAVIEGNMVTLTPEQDWHGETVVTVTAHDITFPNDAAHTRFNLTIMSNGVDPVPPAPEPETPQVDSSDDGGSLGYFVVGLLALAVGRRRKLHPH